MDNLDKKIYQEINTNIEIPIMLETKIKEGLNNNKIENKKSYKSWSKIATTACATVIMTAGIVYAGTAIYEKIWKEPTETIGIVNGNITEEDLKGTMSEKEAKKQAEEIFNKFGYITEKIKTIELEKDGDSIVWHIETNNKLSVSFDAKGGKELWLFSDDILFKDIHNYRTTREEAAKTARKLCEKYGYDLSEYSNVEIGFNMDTEEESYIWYVNFSKELDNLVDRYNQIRIAFIPEINELRYFIITEGKYENNPIEITEEQAKETALKEEQKININYKIKETRAELGIAAMNTDAYARTIDYKQYCEQANIKYPDEKRIEYHTDERIRKVWKVTIEYDIPMKEIFLEDSFNMCDLGYTYYIDATTGEIIGGESPNTDIKVIYENGKLVEVN